MNGQRLAHAPPSHGFEVRTLLTIKYDTKSMSEQPPLVIIEWIDSGQPIPGWQMLNGLEHRRPHRCVSVGFLVQNDAQKKVIAPNLGSSGGDDEWDQAWGLTTIPTPAVTKLKRLTSSWASTASYDRDPA